MECRLNVVNSGRRRARIAARTEEGRGTGGNLQTRFCAHLAPQLRHALVAVGHRHSHGAGVAGALGREYDDDLYPCPESRCRRNRQPVGLLGLALAACLNDGFIASSWLAAQGPKLSSKFTLNEHSICVAQIHTGTQHHPAQTTYRVVNKITTGIVTSASMVDTATLAVTSSCATS